MFYSVSALKYYDEEAAFNLRKDVIHPTVKRQKGCRSVQFLKSLDGSGEYLIIIAWETREDRDAFLRSKDHDELKAQQWPLMSEKIKSKEYELLLD